MYKYVYFYIIITIFHNVSTYNILSIISVPLRSHYMAFQPFFRELSKRGHNVTVVNHYPEETPLPNLTYVNLRLPNDTEHTFIPLEYYENTYSSVMRINNLMNHISIPISGFIDKECRNLFTHERMKAHLAQGVKYDVIFVEQFLSDCALAYAAATYDAPIIGITSHVLMPWSYRRFGIPFDIASDPFYFSSSGPKPALLTKVETTLGLIYFNYIGRWEIQKCIHKVFSEYLPEYSLDVERVANERMKMIFAYQHFSITGSRLMVPQVLEIGGIHVVKPKPLTKDVEEFLADAEHGAIYFSFGSNLKSSTMSEKMLQQILEVFKRIPQKILWKWENDKFPDGHDNVYTKTWFPQLDVLCHPKVIAFISHGGMLSLSEAAHCGTPILAIPFFGDQFTNAASIKHVGLGNMMLIQDINTENLVNVLKELTSPAMQESAKNVSKRWHDRPQSVMDSAIYWTEYVARHGTAPPSVPSKRSTWFESMLIDVYCVIILLFFTFIWLCYSGYSNKAAIKYTLPLRLSYRFLRVFLVAPSALRVALIMNLSEGKPKYTQKPLNAVKWRKLILGSKKVLRRRRDETHTPYEPYKVLDDGSA
ncbi:UDP-glycosyltransferase UGT5-like [Aphomia sociella]